MADPQAARLTQLRNIQTKTGKTIAELHAVLAASGLAKTGERRSLLMERFKLGYGDANTVALFFGQPLPPLDAATPAALQAAPVEDPLDALYAGPKAALRALHVAVMQEVQRLGTFEQAPKKGYISLRRKKQFAMLGPATKSQVELGLNARDLPASPRLKVMPAGGMCQYTVRIAALSEVDAELARWLRAAFESAG